MKYNPFNQGFSMMYRRVVLSAIHTITALMVIKLASVFKVSFIIGSTMAFFSGTSIAVPMLGALTGIGSVIAAVGAMVVGQCAMGIPAAHYLAYHVPGLFASASWVYPTRVMRLIVPLACMVLFVVHPVGLKAFPYALYWLIPVILHIRASQSLFAQALSSTFIAHAVGSVIWLYTVPMTSAAWLALIPVVALERLCFALGMVLVYSAVRSIVTRMLRLGSIVRFSVVK